MARSRKISVGFRVLNFDIAVQDDIWGMIDMSAGT